MTRRVDDACAEGAPLLNRQTPWMGPSMRAACCSGRGVSRVRSLGTQGSDLGEAPCAHCARVASVLDAGVTGSAPKSSGGHVPPHTLKWAASRSLRAWRAAAFRGLSDPYRSDHWAGCAARRPRTERAVGWGSQRHGEPAEGRRCRSDGAPDSKRNAGGLSCELPCARGVAVQRMQRTTRDLER